MYGNNIYYEPEKFGLETIGTIEWAEPNYSFDFSVVWKSKRGEYWVASDSGCSCPYPFEDYNKIEDLDGPYNKKALDSVLNGMVKDNVGGYDSYGEANLRKQVSDLLGRIK